MGYSVGDVQDGIIMKVVFNGRPFNPVDFRDTVMAQIVQQLVEQLRERIGSIRHPLTGEFPTIVVHGSSIDDIRLTVEGSDVLLEKVRAALGEELGAKDRAAVDHEDADMGRLPNVFLSWGSPDKDLANRLATVLRQNGIETWFSEWEIAPGDSFRQRIEAGLDKCTHFIVLLTPNSIHRPWVNIEIDAGLIQKIEEGRRFIPLRMGIAPGDLPPLLRTIHSPLLEDFDRDVQQLVHDIFGISRKPPVGQPPMPKISGGAKGFSDAATAVARHFVQNSRNGCAHDPSVKLSTLSSATGLTLDDVKDAIFELRDLLRLGRGYSGMEPSVASTPDIFSDFDHLCMEWDPPADALRIAVELMNDPGFPRGLSQMSEVLGWPARRLNPAIAFLKRRDLVDVREALGTGHFIALSIDATDQTRRFVKSRSQGSM